MNLLYDAGDGTHVVAGWFPPAEGRVVTEPTRSEGVRRRRRLAAVGVLVAVVLLVPGGIWAVNQMRAQGPVDPPLPTGGVETPATSIPPPTASGAPTVVRSKELRVEEVPIDKSVAVGAGVVVRVVRIESVQGTADGPGEIAGPALRSTVSLENRGKATVDLASAIVNLYYGPKRTPANELSGPGASLLAGKLAPGKTATGINVFAVPTDARASVVVEVLLGADVPVIHFEGTP